MTELETQEEYRRVKASYRARTVEDYQASVDDLIRFAHWWVPNEGHLGATSLCGGKGAFTSMAYRVTCRDCFEKMSEGGQRTALKGHMKYVLGLVRLPLKGVTTKGQHLRKKAQP